VRDWLPARRERCVSRGSRTSRSWRSSERRTGDTVPKVAKRHKISEQTIYAWKKRFGVLQPDDVRRLKQFEQENARLKKLLAERDLVRLIRKSGERHRGPP
jgi:putative transposase